MSLDLLKASDPDGILGVNIKSCGPELSYILNELFSICIRESCLWECWRVSSVIPVFKNVGKSSTARKYLPVSLFSVVSKVFDKFVNNQLVDHLRKCGLFSAFQYGLRSFWSTADLLTDASNGVSRDFNRSGATRAVLLGIFKAFDKVWHAVLLHKPKSCKISGQYLALFCLVLLIDSFKWFCMVSPHKNI